MYSFCTSRYQMTQGLGPVHGLVVGDHWFIGFSRCFYPEWLTEMLLSVYQKHILYIIIYHTLYIFYIYIYKVRHCRHVIYDNNNKHLLIYPDCSFHAPICLCSLPFMEFCGLHANELYQRLSSCSLLVINWSRSVCPLFFRCMTLLLVCDLMLRFVICNPL